MPSCERMLLYLESPKSEVICIKKIDVARFLFPKTLSAFLPAMYRSIAFLTALLAISILCWILIFDEFIIKHLQYLYY